MNPVYADFNDIVDNLKKLKTDKECAEYAVQCFLSTEPSSEEIEEKREVLRNNENIVENDPWISRYFKEWVRKYNLMVLEELNKQTQMGFNPYQE